MLKTIFMMILLQTQLTPEAISASKIDVYVKVVGGVIAVLGFIFGLPVTLQQLKKTRAEIRKLELEAKKIESEGVAITPNQSGEGQEIAIYGDRNNITILTDPRLLAPLLLLLNFIIVIIMLILAEYASDFLILILPHLVNPLLGPRTSLDIESVNSWKRVLFVVLVVVLMLPILREAFRVKQELGKKKESSGETGA
jgi:hypothetical protein